MKEKVEKQSTSLKVINLSLKKIEIEKIKNFILSISPHKKPKNREDINFEIFDLEYDHGISNFMKKFLFLYCYNTSNEENIIYKANQMNISLNINSISESITKFIKIIDSFSILKNFIKINNYKDYNHLINDYNFENYIYYENYYNIRFWIKKNDIIISGTPKKNIEKKMVVLFNNKISKYNLIHTIIEQLNLNLNIIELVENLILNESTEIDKKYIAFCLIFKNHTLYLDYVIKNYLEYLEEFNILNFINN